VKGKRLTLAAAAIVAAVAAAAAYASIPDAAGVIHSCYASDDSLRVIDSSNASCKSKETPLAWNVQGPKGSTGSQGPSGTSQGYFASGDVVGIDRTEHVVGLHTVPPGNYMVWVQANFSDTATYDHQASCFLVVNEFEKDSASNDVQGTGGANIFENANVAMTVAITLPPQPITSIGNSVDVFCTDGLSTTEASANLSLIRLDAVG
jgi:hypothetical protein